MVKDTAPDSLKKALCSLRLSWTLEDLSNMYPNENYDRLIPFLQYKASELYKHPILIECMANWKSKFS